MLGTRRGPSCKTKGAETWGLALFLIDELWKRRESVGGAGCRCLRAGDALEHLILRLCADADFGLRRRRSFPPAHIRCLGFGGPPDVHAIGIND